MIISLGIILKIKYDSIQEFQKHCWLLKIFAQFGHEIIEEWK